MADKIQPSTIKQKFDSNLSGAIEGSDKALYKDILNNSEDVEQEDDTNEEDEMEEAVGASSAGSFVGPLFGSSGKVLNTENRKLIRRTINDILSESNDICQKGEYFNKETKKCQPQKRETDEAVTASSSGSYESPSFLAKSMSKKDWRGASKPVYKDGKFVKVKDKCKAFPYCNEGDITALDLWENGVLKEAISNISERTGKSEEELQDMVNKEIKELIRKGFYKSPITDLVGVSQMDKPIGNVFTMKGNKGKYE